MKFSRTLFATALVVVGSLVLVSAGHYGGGYNSNAGGALTHYGGGGCHGHGCYNRARASAAHGPYGPYHSYAVRPAIYGGHGLYTYQGYARNPSPLAVHAAGHGARYARSYGAGAGRHHGGCNGYNGCGAASGLRHGGYGNANIDNHNLAGYSLRPVKALALVHHQNNGYNNAYRYAAPAHHGGHYRAARGAYGSGHGHGHGNGNGYGAPARHHHHQLAHGNGNGYGVSAADFASMNHHANGGYSNGGYGAGRSHHGGNGGYGAGRSHHGGNGGY